MFDERLDLHISDIAYKILNYSLVIFIALISVLPFLYAVSVVFRPVSAQYELYLIPREFSLTVLESAFDRMDELLWNSFLVSFGTMIVSMFIVIPSAYVFGRLEFTGKTTLFYLVLLTIMFPFILLIIPIAQIWFELGLYNTLPGLWISYQIFVTPFGIWVLRDNFAKLPDNLEESARVYGCTQFTAFLRVILPLATPSLIAIAFLAFLIGWNDFLLSSMLTTGAGPRPAVVGLYLTIRGASTTVPWALILGEMLLVGIPPTILYLIARKSLSESFEVSG